MWITGPFGTISDTTHPLDMGARKDWVVIKIINIKQQQQHYYYHSKTAKDRWDRHDVGHDVRSFDTVSNRRP
jgi:hypothetical protein